MNKNTKVPLPKLIVIYGPTATGKTNLAIELAKKYNGEIVSADSRQIYKYLDIGTGKVNFKSKVEKYNSYWIVDGVKIHGFDIKYPGDSFSVADFIKFASKSYQQINRSKKLPILVGGTGFYLKSFLYGLESAGIGQNIKLRNALSNLTASQLYDKLLKLNSQRAELLNESDIKNPRRLIRAIEIEKSKSDYRTHEKEKFEGKLKIIGLTAPNEYLYKKADKWLQERLQKGLVDEIKRLLETVNYRWLVSLGLEYKWLTQYAKGEISEGEAIERLKGDIHDFIRRQKTWFRQFKKIEIYDISKKDTIRLIKNTLHDLNCAFLRD